VTPPTGVIPWALVDLNHLNLRVRDARACRDFYERHFGFRLAFEADGGYFVRNDDGFVLALIPVDPHQALPDGFHIGFGLADAEAVTVLNRQLAATGLEVAEVEDFRPAEDYVTFRCWDPDGTEVEVFWEAGAQSTAEDTPTPSAVSTRDELLAALAGEWSGTYRLWLEPGEE
jgi:catechol 2,3-dioxygenase-like lactoylglutathione lyase family enzyme